MFTLIKYKNSLDLKQVIKLLFLKQTIFNLNSKVSVSIIALKDAIRSLPVQDLSYNDEDDEHERLNVFLNHIPHVQLQVQPISQLEWTLQEKKHRLPL